MKAVVTPELICCLCTVVKVKIGNELLLMEWIIVQCLKIIGKFGPNCLSIDRSDCGQVRDVLMILSRIFL